MKKAIRFYLLICVALLLGTFAFATILTVTSSAVAQEQPKYFAVNLDASKANQQAVTIAKALLGSAKDAKDIFAGGDYPDIGAQFLDASKTKIAAQITSDCGTLGCQTFIFVLADPKKNIWVRALDELTYALWVMDDKSGEYKVVIKGLKSDPMAFALYSDNKFYITEFPAPSGTQQ
jgi:hypothetical protein